MVRFVMLFLGYVVVRMFALTYRFREAVPVAQRLPHDRPRSYVLAIWHQNLFSGILAQCGRKHTVIVSRSRDGEPAAFLCQNLGHHVVRGSSRKGEIDKGGKLAQAEMIEVLRSGLPGAVTVDGPRGPAFQVKPGIIEMARLSGVAIVPYATLPTRYWRFNSWDSFRLPKPFSRIDVHYGTPIVVPESTAFEEFPRYQQAIVDALHAIEHEHGREARPQGATLAPQPLKSSTGG